MLDTLLYVLKDGLLRLTNVRKLQCAKKCGTYFMALAVLFSFYGGGGGEGGGVGEWQSAKTDCRHNQISRKADLQLCTLF